MNAFSSEIVRIDLADRSYDIVIASDVLGNIDLYRDLPTATSAVIVTNTTVAPLYADTLRQALRTRFAAVHVVALPDGEQYKTWQTLNLVFDALLGNACDRRTVLFALGGGVVGDMTGFAAASYMRGVPVCAGANHLAGPGGLVRWWQDGRSTTPWART